MIDHLLILETRAGSADILKPSLTGLDCRGDPWVLSLAEVEVRRPAMDCHNIFLDACQRIEDFMEVRKVRLAVSRVVAVVDSVTWSQLDPLNTAGEYQRGKSSALVSLLVLAFPEVFWGFVHLLSPGTETAEHHSLDTWIGKHCGRVPPIEPLMDPTGLRNHVRHLAAATLKRDTTSRTEPLPFRQEWGVALDDESAYAYFNAYTEYRHGFRAGPLSSWAAAKHLLEPKHENGSPPMVSVEDLYISFPDVPSREGSRVSLSDLTQRDEQFPLLKRVKHRVILTSGTRRKGARRLLQEIERRKARRLLKPIGGMFSMWKKSGLWRKLRIQDRERKHWIGGYAPGFHPGVTVDPSDKGVGHSAPGALLSVAEVLLERAGRIKNNIATVEDVVLGAVLATDAFELLASRTPTLSLDALMLKHELEVRAECCFNGVQNHFDVRSRMRKIQKAVKMFSRWFDPWHQDVACWNGEAAVLSRLKTVFHEHEQFDEEGLYISRSRTLHRRLWFRQYFGKVFGTWLRHFNPIYWAAWYVSFLLRSIPIFVLMLLVWFGGLTCAFYEVEVSLEHFNAKNATMAKAVDPQSDDNVIKSTGPWTRAMQDAFSCMVSVGAPLHDNVVKQNDENVIRWANLLACLGMGSGFLHLGILISHLYSVVSRK